MMRFLNPLAIGLLALCLSGSVHQDRWYRQVAAQFANDVVNLGYRNFTLSHDVHWGRLDHGYHRTFRATFQGGRTYVILGRCDADCYDLDLKVLRADGTVFRQDIAPDDVPEVIFTPARTVTYQVRPVMAGCDGNPCRYGVAIFSD